MSSAISQLCSSPVNRRLCLRLPSVPFRNLRSKVLIVARGDGSSTEISNSQTKTTLSYNAEASRSPIEGSISSYPATEGNRIGKGVNGPVQEQGVCQPKRAAKIHDFCLGIPFGGLILSGGLAGFIFTRNLSTLSTGVVFGGTLLALSTLSLKVWRQGKSCLPFILGQAVLATTLVWKNIQAYYLTKKLFPSGIFSVVSAAMLCFYSYVVLSGGNPPPKKKSPVVVAS